MILSTKILTACHNIFHNCPSPLGEYLFSRTKVEVSSLFISIGVHNFKIEKTLMQNIARICIWLDQTH